MSKKVIKVEANVFSKALAAASLGGGKGYVMIVNPSVNANGKNIQICILASSDGEKLGRCTVQVQTNGIEETEAFYPVKSIYKSVETLAKVTDTIVIKVEDSYLELSAESGENRVRVALNEKDILFDVPEEEMTNSVSACFKREDFVTAIKCGGYAASKAAASTSLKAIYFGVSADKICVISAYSAVMAEATVKPQQMANAPDQEVFYPADDVFINAVAGRLTGDQCQIGFTDKYVIISDSAGPIYVARKKAAQMSTSLRNILNMEERDYEAEISKKELFLGIEIATVGLEDRAAYVMCHTAEDGTLCLESPHAENKANIVQSKHEGSISGLNLGIEALKLLLSGCGEKIGYYGMNDRKPIHFYGTDGVVTYRALIAQFSGEKTDAAKKKEK